MSFFTSKTEFKPIKATLLDGRIVFIREASKKDAQAIIRLTTACLMQSDNLISKVEEFNPTIKQQENWIAQAAQNRNSILLVAVENGKLVGNLELKGEGRQKVAHNAVLGIIVLNTHQHCGLGKLLLKSAIEWAQLNPHIEKIWLEVFETNKIAMRLYEKYGFKKIATQAKYIKTTMGYVDNIIMQFPTI